MPTARLPASLAPLLLLGVAANAQDLHLPLDRLDPTWRGATAIADGALGGAAHFDGQDARIDCGPCPIDGKAPFSLRLSLRTTRADFCTPLMARAGEAVGLSIVIGRQPGVLSFEAWSWGSVKLLSKGRIDDGRWHAVEVAYDPASTAALLFVDGALQGCAELGNGGSPAASLRLGDNIGAHQPFLGDLDEVHFEGTLTHRERFAGMAAVLPLAEREAALRHWRESMLPRHTSSLEPAAQPDWPKRRLQVRAHVADSLGLVPEPVRSPLEVQVHGELRGDGFVAQRVSWQSWSHGDWHYRASGWLWLPDPLTAAPHAAVLCPHGHWQDGALHPVVQARCMSFARLGWITLAVDSVHVEDVASGVSAIGAMTWNNLRALELLQARADVDRTRIAVTGASGGGQQTYYLMALRDDFAAAAPICMTCYFAEILTDDAAHCGCNHPPRLAGGTDVIEMAAVMAPKPAFFGSVTGDWTAHFPQQGWPELQGLWQRLGAGAAIGARHADEGHNYDQPMREAVYAFLRPVLQPDAGLGPVPEPPVAPLAVRDLRALGGPAPRTPPDQQALAAEFLARRPKVTALPQLAPALPWRVDAAPIAWRGAEGAAWGGTTPPRPGGAPVPFLVSAVDDGKAPWIVVDADGGKAALLAAAPQWLGLPRVVLVDPRCRGEWQRFAPYWRRNGLILGCGEGYLAAHDLAQVCQSLPGDAPVTVVGLGAAGIEALLAATISPRITHVVTDDFGPFYSEDGNRLPFCPELSRYGGVMQLLRDVEGRCELRLGGTARGATAPAAARADSTLAPVGASRQSSARAGHPDDPTRMQHALTLQNVTKRFGTFTAVDDLSVQIPTGCIYGFLGQNGAGKTTTIRMVMSIFHQDAGTISVLGHPDAAEVKDKLGYLPEEKGLYKKMKTAEIVAYFGKLKGMAPKVANDKARELLTRYGLGDWLDKKCETMSKGMGQKVQILGTIIHDPELVILDEPFSGLDPVNRDVMRDTILQMKREGRTVIFSTHVMEQAEQLCDQVMMIHRGQLQFAGPLSQIKGGRDSGIRLDYDGDSAVLHQLPELEHLNDSGKSAEIYLRHGADPQQALRWLIDHVTVRRFDYREPSLHEIFVRTVEAANERLGVPAAAEVN